MWRAIAAIAPIIAALTLARPASAQRMPREWSAQHARDAIAQVREPRGAVPLLRLWGQRDQLAPAFLADQIHAMAVAPGAPAMRRALALYLEADVRARMGQQHDAQQTLRALGFITRWQFIGPFDNEGRQGFTAVMPIELARGERPDAARSYDGKERAVRWRLFPDISRDGFVALDAVARPAQNACVFAHTTVTSPRDGDAVLWLGAAGQIRAYVNAVSVYSDEVVRSVFPDRAGARVRLHRGANRVLLKVCTDEHDLGFMARFTHVDGTPASELTVDPDPAAAPEQLVPGATPHPASGHPAPVVAPTVVLGVLQELRALAERDHAPAQVLEDYARFVALTRSDDLNTPMAADLAERAAQAEPTASRWLLTADLASDRNRRLVALRHAEELAPDDPFVLASLGHERRMGAHPDEAIPLLDRAIAGDDAFIPPRIERALVLDGLGLSLAAYHEAVAALDRDPQSPAVLRACAVLADHAQLFDEAYALRQRYLRAYADPAVLESVAREARVRGDRERARELIDRMLTVEPDRLPLYLAAAEVLEAIGRSEEAHGIYDRAIEIAPDEPAFWRARGELEIRTGQRDQARASLRRALALSPQDRSLRQHIEALEPPLPRPDEAIAEASATFLARRAHGAAAGGGYKVRGLQDLTVRTVYPNGLAGAFHQTVIEILTEEGAEAARQFPIMYEPQSQRFELRAARVYHPNGEVDESASMDEFALTAGPSRMYFDNREVVVAFPRLRPGDVIELRWRVDDVSQRNAFANYFGDLAVLQAEYPRARVQYVLRAPADRQLYFHVPQLARLTRAERTEGANRVYDFAATDVAAVPPEEHAPGVTERAAYLHVSTYRTWEEVGHWYWGLISEQLQVDDRVRAVVRDITRGLNTPAERVRAIYNWVIHNTRYVALEFGIHGFLPYRVPEICSRGFGDCKDKASTIIAMLREVGIDASIVLVRTRNNGDIDTTPASLAVFDHAIAYVPPFEGYPEGLFLDGTAQSSGIDDLPTGDQGAMVLIVNQRGEARLTHIPIYTADRNTITTRAEVTLDAAGAATLHTVEDARGPSAGGVRALLEAQATRAERVERALSGTYPGVHVSEVRAGDMNDVDHPAHFEYTAAIPNFATRQGNTLMFSATAALNLTREFAGRSTRTSDVMIGGTITTDERRTFRFAPGVTLGDVPPDARIDSPFITLELTFERQGATLVVHRVVRTLVDRVPAAQYAAFRDVCQRIDDALSRRVTLRLP